MAAAAAAAVNSLRLIFPLAVLGALIVSPPEAALADNDGNHMLSGQTVLGGDELNWGEYKVVMQDDCNLVVENGGWESGTAHKGTACRLVLTHNGELQILNGQEAVVWTSKSSSKEGDYVAIIHPEGNLVVYGPTLWQSKIFPTSTARKQQLAANRSSTRITTRGPHMVPGAVETSHQVGNTRPVHNAMFSGEILFNGGRLHTKIYALIMQNDCNLVEYNGNFVSDTHSRGQNCFLRLDHFGGLTILDDIYRTVWKNDGPRGAEGHYVALLQDNGRFVVRGPAIWSSKPLN